MFFILIMLVLAGLNFYMGQQSFANPTTPLWVAKMDFAMVGWCLAFIVQELLK